jgi:hypothetical protein
VWADGVPAEHACDLGGVVAYTELVKTLAQRSEPFRPGEVDATRGEHRVERDLQSVGR